MNPATPTVYFIESDAEIQNAVVALLASHEVPCELFVSGEDFLRRFDPRLAGCVISEVFLPAMSGLDVLQTVVSRATNLPVILSSGGADVRMAVEAMRCGAMSFLEKPYNAGELIEAIQTAFRLSARMLAVNAREAELLQRFELLVPRERQLARMILQGKTNKCISRLLGACERTIERLRAKVFETMRVESAPQLATLLAALKHPDLEDAEMPQRVHEVMPAHSQTVRPLAWPVHSLLPQSSMSGEVLN